MRFPTLGSYDGDPGTGGEILHIEGGSLKNEVPQPKMEILGRGGKFSILRVGGSISWGGIFFLGDPFFRVFHVAQK
jgi:hypothetical protein